MGALAAGALQLEQRRSLLLLQGPPLAQPVAALQGPQLRLPPHGQQGQQVASLEVPQLRLRPLGQQTQQMAALERPQLRLLAHPRFVAMGRRPLAPRQPPKWQPLAQLRPLLLRQQLAVAQRLRQGPTPRLRPLAPPLRHRTGRQGASRTGASDTMAAL